MYAYVIMDNHLHLLIEVSKTPLSKIMQFIQQTYTQYYNKKYDRTGNVFEQRYKAMLCNRDEYLLELIRYIHKNPEKAKISDINYKWSSHKEYIGKNFGICDIDFPLSMFSNYKKEAENRYLEYVTDAKIDREIDYKLVLEEDIDMSSEIKYDSFYYKAGSWADYKRVVCKVALPQSELLPRVSFIVTSLELNIKQRKAC
ncbi:transposase [Wukongibacter sp. M2B1]|uniref:transposase n=1 Tax=Wukongibacter sp. M2B1 TaxID=3088895 RepID=UPI003D791084